MEIKRWTYGIIILLVFVLYGNTIPNDYSLDDSYITSNEHIKNGISGIPYILTHRFGIESLNIELDYRPITLTIAAIEYQFFKANPHISHFINVFLYAIVLIILYQCLISIFKLDTYNKWLPLIIVLLYAVHPLHTEVVASIKNRDELLSLLFGLLFLKNTYNYFTINKKRSIYACLSIIFLALALFSKLTGILFLPISILILLHERLLKWNKWNYLFISLSFLVLIFILWFNLYGMTRQTYIFENSLIGVTDLSIIIPTCFKIIFYHIKMLFFPFPLRYYYGNNMFPLHSKLEITVIFSAILHIGLLIVGIKKMIKKEIIGLFILCYLVCVGFYSNFLIPYTGMFSERALFVSSIWFIAGLLLFIFETKFLLANKLIRNILSVILFLFFITFCFQTIQRNFYWKDIYTLATKDMPHLENSIAANNNYANLLYKMSKETTDFVRSKEIAEDAAIYYQRALRLFPYYPRYYFQYATLLRYQLNDIPNATKEYMNTLALDKNDVGANFELGKIYFERNDFKNSYPYFIKAYSTNPKDSITLFYLGQNALKVGDLTNCYKVNKEFMDLYPDIKYPYLNLGVYYSTILKDDSAVIYFEKGIALGDKNPDLIKNMVIYFERKQNIEKATYYQNLLQ
jgi:tetratricopeptide (TPR) repeat protein